MSPRVVALGSFLLITGLAALTASPGPGWTLTFADEFEGEQLAADRWQIGYPWPRIINNELQAYVPHAVTVRDGRLHLTARREPGTQPGRDFQPRQQEFTSGAVTTFGAFAQRYGWFEARLKIPAGRGLWPAFWLMPLRRQWPPEIDVMEILGQRPNRVHFTLHWRDAEEQPQKASGRFDGPDFSADFHVFSIEWSPGLIIWRVDGEERHRTAAHVPDEPFYVLLNLAVGGDWPGPPDEHTAFPATLLVDYVRVYARDEPPAP